MLCQVALYFCWFMGILGTGWGAGGRYGQTERRRAVQRAFE
jgi:hypothetical protein